MEKIFYQNNGCTISDTVFITPTGDQYPIRNISSVKVREKNYWKILLLGIFILFLAYSNDAPFPFVIGLITIAIWWFKREFILWIGSGGVHQEALKFKKITKGGITNIQEIYDALNLSIANMQNR
jgi:hypothetical protein